MNLSNIGSTSNAITQIYIREVLQKVYRNTTSAMMDTEAAVAIVDAFKRAGWFSAAEVTVLVKAAGGEISVSDEPVSGTLVHLYDEEDRVHTFRVVDTP